MNRPALGPIMPLLNSFMAQWKEQGDAVGFLLTGSWSDGKPTEQSDIDLRVVLKPDVLWLEKEAYLHQGKRINSWAFPAPTISKRFQDQWKQYLRFDARCFSKGLILEDTDQVIQSLKLEAHQWMKRPFPSLAKNDRQLLQYGVVSGAEELKKKNPNSPFFPHHYIRSLRSVWELYQKRFGLEDIHEKFEEFFTNEDLRLRYDLKEIPHKEFKSMFIASLQAIKTWDDWQSFDELLNFVLQFFDPVTTHHFRLKLYNNI